MNTNDTEHDERMRGAIATAEFWWGRGYRNSAIVTLAEEVARLDAVVTAVRELHYERDWRQADGMPLGGTVCNHCRTMWPCSTVITLGGRHHE